MRILYLMIGLSFGFLLSRAGATTYDYYASLFLFQNLQLLWVIVSAIGVGLVGTMVIKKAGLRTLIGHAAIDFKGKPYKDGLVMGSLLFGAGWGLSGSCPGTALAMLGQGKLMAMFAVVGMVIGTYLYAVLPGLSRAQPAS